MSTNQSLNSQRLSNTGCDVIIQIGRRSFFAHRETLIARVDYFRKVLKPEERLLNLDPEVVKADHFEAILQFIYVNEIQFTPDNLQPIWATANMLCFTELLQKAEDYVKQSITLTGVSMPGLEEIFTGSVTDFLSAKCEHLLSLNPFSKLARKLFVPLLTIESLNRLLAQLNSLSKQEEMVEYCLEWVSSDKVDKLAGLLRTIPLSCLSFAELKKLSANELIKNSTECLSLLAETFSSASQTDRLYVLGGYDSNGALLNSVSYIDSSAQWKSAAPMPEGLSDFGSVSFGSRIYICGGWNDKMAQSPDLWVLETTTNEWKKLASMEHPRCHFGMARIGEYIYVAGGECQGVWLNSVVRYCIRLNRWESVASMLYIRSSLELVADDKFLYALGGTASTVMERYDPERNEWSPMNGIRATGSFGAALFQSRLFIVSESSIEIYNLVNDSYRDCGRGYMYGIGCELVEFNGELLFVGGNIHRPDQQGCAFRGVKAVKRCDFIDGFQFNPWVEMDVGRCLHKAVVVHRS